MSLDGGVTFGPGVTVASTNVSFLRTSPAGYNRFNRNGLTAYHSGDNRKKSRPRLCDLYQ